jgi:dipeptidyl aminopeptidase/acylaminoacyl peptidase
MRRIAWIGPLTPRCCGPNSSAEVSPDTASSLTTSGLGAWRKVLAEEDPKFVYTFNARYRHDLSDDLTLWASERSGWNHLYAVDLRTGRTIRPLTSGQWVVEQVTHLDAAAKEIYFQAVGRVAGENPYHTHLCKVGLDGNGFVDLTPDDAYHEVSFSPDRRTFLDTASRVDVPHAFFLRSATDGRLIATLGVSDDAELRKAGWQPARPFVAKDREGKFDIWGVVTRPTPSTRRRNIRSSRTSTPALTDPSPRAPSTGGTATIASFPCSDFMSCKWTVAGPTIAARSSISRAGAT